MSARRAARGERSPNAPSGRSNGPQRCAPGAWFCLTRRRRSKQRRARHPVPARTTTPWRPELRRLARPKTTASRRERPHPECPKTTASHPEPRRPARAPLHPAASRNSRLWTMRKTRWWSSCSPAPQRPDQHQLRTTNPPAAAPHLRHRHSPRAAQRRSH